VEIVEPGGGAGEGEAGVEARPLLHGLIPPHLFLFFGTGDELRGPLHMASTHSASELPAHFFCDTTN
jgi:hypothetical protein